jgi:GTP-binding protein
MSFIDKVRVNVQAGKGGDGKMSFRKEKFIDRGGPDGGDGGDGGHIILMGSRNQNTLAAFRYQREIKADPGRPGGKTRMHGRRGKSLVVQVPVGTIATTLDGLILADMTEDGQEVIIAKGGKGGFGNAHFVSSRRQAPKFAEIGEPGEVHDLTLELKVIADVGLVGLPNAGKSTLLSKISNARPEIADYAFTTLRPNLGVVDIDNSTSVLFADIPGLIEGASEGKGLGHAFLRHIERTAVIVHLIDCYQDDIGQTYLTIKAELAAYTTDLTQRPEIIALNKIDGLDDEIIADLIAKLVAVAPVGTKIHAISALSGAGMKEFLSTVKETVAVERAATAAIVEEIDNSIPVLTIQDNSGEWQVTKETGFYIVRGQKIEQFARRTNFNNEEGVQRLRDIMKKLGIMHQLVRSGIEADDIIQIGDVTDQQFGY